MGLAEAAGYIFLLAFIFLVLSARSYLKASAQAEAERAKLMKGLAEMAGRGTCLNVSHSSGRFLCSECGAEFFGGVIVGLRAELQPRYCPMCGRRVDK